jgi:NAD(P)-dependent dehydrogenase (short-subunit alcohol dehydrogenase family)
MNRLQDKVAVITGGNSGIGFATAREFIANGAKVIITGRDQSAIDKAVQKLGHNAIGIRADAANMKDTEDVVEKVQLQFGKVDILFVNAGVFFAEPIGQITEQTFHKIMDVNFKGAVFTTEKFLPLLSEGASIIHLSSVSAFAVGTGTAVYAASKAALNAYSRTAAIELASRKIRVNTITPGMVDTGLSAKAGFPDESIEQMKVFMSNKIPFRRYATPEEVAKLALFLASDDASFITGSEYTIDGGATVNEPFRA